MTALQHFFLLSRLNNFSQGVSVWPFLALLRTQRSSDLYLKRTPRARLWCLVIFCAHRTHTCNFCKSRDGYQLKSKLVLELPNDIRFLIQIFSFPKSKYQVFMICNKLVNHLVASYFCILIECRKINVGTLSLEIFAQVLVNCPNII